MFPIEYYYHREIILGLFFTVNIFSSDGAQEVQHCVRTSVRGHTLISVVIL